MPDTVRDADLASIQLFVIGILAGGLLFAWRGWWGIALGIGGACLAVAWRILRGKP